MHTLLQFATDALAANDADRLEALCREAEALRPSAADVDALTQGLRVLQRQLGSARQNVILRERLLQKRCGEVLPWER